MRLLIDGAMVWDGTGAKPFAGKAQGPRRAAGGDELASIKQSFLH